MKDFSLVYIPVGVPTFHLESAQDQFERSIKLLRSVDANAVCPDKMLLTWTICAPTCRAWSPT